MKLCLIIYNGDYDEDVMEMLNSLGVTGFTKWDRVLGKGKNSEPRLDDPVWPGFNCAIAAVISDDEQERIVQELKKFSFRLDGKGFKVFVLPVLAVI
ncbi:MAG: transcriptional regulator [Thermoanaerobacteraceae bacterium]|nr:transcriptional regulator [Thermoanaerobacteraceae bacterium]